MMRNVLVFLFFFIVGLAISYGYVHFYKKVEPKNENVLGAQLQTKPQEQSTFSIEPAPKNSITGKITALSGDILFESRLATAPSALDERKDIRQGERLITGPDGEATIEFDDTFNVVISEDSEVSFVQTLPTNFVFNQPQGTVSYKKKGGIPFTLRSRQLLVSFNRGDMTVEIDEENGTIYTILNEGTAQIAYNDLEYRTNTVNLSEKETFVYNIEERVGTIEENE